MFLRNKSVNVGMCEGFGCQILSQRTECLFFYCSSLMVLSVISQEKIVGHRSNSLDESELNKGPGMEHDEDMNVTS